MVDPIEIEIKISNKSIQEFQNGLKKIKIEDAELLRRLAR